MIKFKEKITLKEPLLQIAISQNGTFVIEKVSSDRFTFDRIESSKNFPSKDIVGDYSKWECISNKDGYIFFSPNETRQHLPYPAHYANIPVKEGDIMYFQFIPDGDDIEPIEIIVEDKLI